MRTCFNPFSLQLATGNKFSLPCHGWGLVSVATSEWSGQNACTLHPGCLSLSIFLFSMNRSLSYLLFLCCKKQRGITTLIKKKCVPHLGKTTEKEPNHGCEFIEKWVAVFHSQAEDREVQVRMCENDFSWRHNMSYMRSHYTSHINVDMPNLYVSSVLSRTSAAQWAASNVPHPSSGPWLPLCGHIYLTHFGCSYRLELSLRLTRFGSRLSFSKQLRIILLSMWKFKVTFLFVPPSNRVPGSLMPTGKPWSYLTGVLRQPLQKQFFSTNSPACTIYHY